MLIAVTIAAAICASCLWIANADYGRLLIEQHGGKCIDFSGGRTVSVAGSAKFDDNDLLRILHPSLIILDLTDTSVSDIGLQRLADCDRLLELDLTGTDVTDAGYAAFLERNPCCRVVR